MALYAASSDDVVGWLLLGPATSQMALHVHCGAAYDAKKADTDTAM